MDAKSCKIQKTLHFTHFDQKNTHISGCKIVHKYTIATVTVHICTTVATVTVHICNTVATVTMHICTTVTVALAFNIIVIFTLSLSLVALTLHFSHLLKSSNHEGRSNHHLIKSSITTAADCHRFDLLPIA